MTLRGSSASLIGLPPLHSLYAMELPYIYKNTRLAGSRRFFTFCNSCASITFLGATAPCFLDLVGHELPCFLRACYPLFLFPLFPSSSLSLGLTIHTLHISCNHHMMCVAEELTEFMAAKDIFMPDLEIDLRPPLKSLGSQVNVCLC